MLLNSLWLAKLYAISANSVASLFKALSVFIALKTDPTWDGSESGVGNREKIVTCRVAITISHGSFRSIEVDLISAQTNNSSFSPTP
jgi:hypothetical protein